MAIFGKHPTRNSEARKRKKAIEKKLAYKKYLKTSSSPTKKEMQSCVE